jgi:3',5'-cyclic AMP phosphodiesterase CpdA
MRLIVDPRGGDIEDDASSTKRHSLLSLAGSMLVEVSFAKLLVAWVVLILLPGALLGLAPLLLTAWLSVTIHKAAALAGIGSLLVLCFIAAVGLLGLRHVFGVAERSFWSLTALLVQPIYALAREGMRHGAEHLLRGSSSDARRERVRATGTAIAGVLVFAVAAAVAMGIWPFTRWTASFSDLTSPFTLLPTALANMVLLVVGYLGVGSLFWGIADMSMEQPRSLPPSCNADGIGPKWRIAHLSDIHLVGERYGYRIECGRDGPSGNRTFETVLARLETIHAEQPLDFVIITGDLTDAGRSSEWAEFWDMVAKHPTLLERMLILPGNHDINVVDRANPARFELPISPGKRLRQMRALSSICGVQGSRAHVVDPESHRMGACLSDAIVPHSEAIKAFAETGGLSVSWKLGQVWSDVFPLIVPPAAEDGLGIVLLNSNAEANFSFTNALGLVPFEDAKALLSVIRAHPKACWLVALHHHLVEYPMPAEAFSERIGTALINGSWFVRELKSFAHRIAVLHGHRHIDWIGACGQLRIISAPSPVMPAKRSAHPAFYVHTFGASMDGLALLSSDQFEVPASLSGDYDQTSLTIGE